MRKKREPLIPSRVRHPPCEGFSWIDRRFARKHAPSLSREAVLLYFWLCAVADKNGLSFYGDAKTGVLLRTGLEAVHRARDELQRHDLIAYECPFTQVLSLPVPRRRQGSGLRNIGEILREILGPQNRGEDKS